MLISWWNKKRKEKWDKMLKEYVNAPKSDYGNCKQLSNGKLASATYQFYGGGEHFPYPYRIVHSPRGLRIHSLVETEPLYKYMVCDITSNIIGTDSAIDAFSEYRGLDK